MDIRNPGSQAGSTLEEASMRAGSAGSAVASRAHHAVDQVAGRMHDAADRLSASSEQWIASGDEMMESLRSYVRERPMMALGIAAGVGFILSRIMR